MLQGGCVGRIVGLKGNGVVRGKSSIDERDESDTVRKNQIRRSLLGSYYLYFL